ncbi:MAG: CDP-alcohol phosphatidyltransferase family protein, partial [Ignavibacteriales bacterium]|nr:CDP-alcohol phosphatidyltransferase family protein [Ignavibacteriales bacterium]
MKERIKRLRHEYRSSLKAHAAEEMADLLLFRPFGFVIANALRSSTVRPLHITILSMIAGVGGGILLGVSAESGLVLAVFLLWLSTVLDCADGQLARLQHSTSSAGRIVDGIIDYAVGIAVFAGIGFRGNPLVSDTAWWGIVGAAGMSYALQAMMYDLFRTEYLGSLPTREFTGPPKDTRRSASLLTSDGLTGRISSRYSHYQKRFGEWLGTVEDNEPTRRHLRLWGLNGTSTHMLVLI